MDAQINEFRFDETTNWRIDWLGGILLGSGSKVDPQIVVYLTALKPDFYKVFSNASIQKPERRRFVFINIAQIALARIGSVWRNGLCVAIGTGQRSELNFSTSHDQVLLTQFDETVDVGQLSPVRIFDPSRYKVGYGPSLELATSPVALIVLPTPIDGVRFVAIPCSVIFQKVFATSSKAVRKLLYGELDKIADPRKSGFVEGEPDTYKVTLFKDFHDFEGKTIANIKADPVANAEYVAMRKTLIEQKVNEVKHLNERQGLPHLRLGLPFSNPVTMTVCGKHLPLPIGPDGRTEWGFLATEILTLKTQLVFKKLAVERKNNNLKGKNAHDPDLKPAYPAKRKTDPPASDSALPLTSSETPDADIKQQNLNAPGNFEAEGLEVLDREKDLQRYKNARLLKPKNPQTPKGKGSTGEPHGSTSGVVPASVNAEPAPSVPPTLVQTLKAILILKSKGIQISTIRVSPLYRIHEESQQVVNFFRRRGGAIRNWRLMNSHETPARTRGFIVIEVFHSAAWHYFIDVEHKRHGELSMLHLRAQNGLRIDPRQLGVFMENVARHNGWRAMQNYENVWIAKKIKHLKSQNETGFARTMARSFDYSFDS